MLAVTAYSQVSYGNINLGSYRVKINVYTENNNAFLHVIFMSARKKITSQPKLLLRLMDDTVISLDGIFLSSSSKSDGGIVMNGIVISESYNITEASFPITHEQMHKLKLGVKKLRLNTTPKFHEKEWSHDKIGKKLYDAYIKSSTSSFEEGF